MLENPKDNKDSALNHLKEWEPQIDELSRERPFDNELLELVSPLV